jgi:hypothetical protein
MLSILGPRGHLGDCPSRRELFTVGSLALLGLSLPELLRGEAKARTTPSARRGASGLGKAKSVRAVTKANGRCPLVMACETDALAHRAGADR